MEEEGLINRLEATRYLVGRVPQALIVAGPGNAKFDLAATGDRPQHFYIWNSLGLAPSIGLGLALAQPEQQVIVLDGDGGTLMNPGALVTIARLASPNLLHIVWDNGQYQSKTLDVESPRAKDVLMLLVDEGLIVKAKEDLYFHAEAVKDLQQRLVDFLVSNGEITTPQFKEMTGVSRKYLIPLIEHFDAQNVTIRIGDIRKLRNR